MKSTINKLTEVAEMPSLFGLKRGTTAFALISELMKFGKAYSITRYGSGKNTSYISHTYDVTRALTKAGVSFRVGNDAPRGGAYGEFIAINIKTFKPAIKDLR